MPLSLITTSVPPERMPAFESSCLPAGNWINFQGFVQDKCGGLKTGVHHLA